MAWASLSTTTYRLSLGRSLRLRNMIGGSSEPNCCDMTAPNPVSDASVCTKKGRMKSGVCSTGSEHRVVFSSWKMASAGSPFDMLRLAKSSLWLDVFREIRQKRGQGLAHLPHQPHQLPPLQTHVCLARLCTVPVLQMGWASGVCMGPDPVSEGIGVTLRPGLSQTSVSLSVRDKSSGCYSGQELYNNSYTVRVNNFSLRQSIMGTSFSCFPSPGIIGCLVAGLVEMSRLEWGAEPKSTVYFWLILCYLHWKKV